MVEDDCALGDPVAPWNLKDRRAALGSNRIGPDLRWSRLASLSCWPGLQSDFESNLISALGCCAVSLEPIPPNTLDELRRDMERRRLISDQIRQIEDARLERIEQAPADEPHAMVRLLARVIGVGIETADMLVQEVLARNMRDRRAVARYAGLTGSPDESGTKRREKGLARSGSGDFSCSRRRAPWRSGFGPAPRPPVALARP